MIPEEVAEIAYILRNSYDTDHLSEEDEFDYSVEIAWKIYNLKQLYDKVNLEGSY